jgi:hypothetical protein
MKPWKSLIILIVLFVAARAHAQFDPLGMMRDMQYGPMVLLIRPEVQKELKLNRSQNDTLRKLQKEYMSETQKLLKNMQRDEPAKALEMSKQVDALQTAYEKRALEPLSEEQRKRFSEIRIQALGAQAAFDPEIQTALAVTDSQKEKLTPLSREYNVSLLRMLQEARDPGKVKKAREALSTEYKAKVAAILSAEQNTQLKAMEGAPFKDVAKLGF